MRTQRAVWLAVLLVVLCSSAAQAPLTKPGVLAILRELEKGHAEGQLHVYPEEVFLWSHLKKAVRSDQPGALEASAAVVEVTAKRLKDARRCSTNGSRVLAYTSIGFVVGAAAAIALYKCAATASGAGARSDGRRGEKG